MKKINEVTSREELAVLLNVELKTLAYVLYVKHTENMYISFEILKRNGEKRKINAPIEPLKRIQTRLSSILWDVYEQAYINNNHDGIAQGFIKKRSIFTNANHHTNKLYVLNIDLEDFFDSFHFGRVKGFFQKNANFKLPENISIILAQLTCFEGKLPQGAPTSPVITNLICCILDNRILKLSKKYKLEYTRYVDDLTFSTNDKHFPEHFDAFIKELSNIIIKSGFSINSQKTNIFYCQSRQKVTGMVVNNRVNIDKNYYKTTRAMADHLYRGETPMVAGNPLTINQLEGRFSFINQVDKFQNVLDVYRTNNKLKSKNDFRHLNSHEKQYQLFLFYKYFYSNNNPLLITEGKTDIIYLKCAIKKMYTKYPNLIERKKNGRFEYKVRFLNKSDRLSFFLNLNHDGGNALKSIYNFYTGKDHFPNLYNKLKSKNNTILSQNPVILVFDNEQKKSSKKPLADFLNHIKYKDVMLKTCDYHITDNLYLLTTPLVKNMDECEIEDLFPDEVLQHRIGGRQFSRKDEDKNKFYNKDIFSQYIKSNYKSLDFSNFIPMLDALNRIIEQQSKSNKQGISL